MSSDEISFGVDNEGWIRLCEISNKWLFIANKFNKKGVVSDSGKDRAQQYDAEGYVRGRPKREWDLKEALKD